VRTQGGTSRAESASTLPEGSPESGPLDTPTRFFFVHVLKTAGNSLLLRLRRCFDEAAIYPRASDLQPFEELGYLNVDRLLEQWALRGDSLRVIAGHFPLCASEILGAPFTTLTVLREPVARTLSFLRHERTSNPAVGDWSLEQIYEDPDHFDHLIHNHMVKMFALTPEEMTQGAVTPVTFTRAHLERAKQRLTTVDVVGLQEHFEEFCSVMSRRFGLDLGPPLRANATEPAAVSRALRRRIEHDNELEIELYEFACDLWTERQPGSI
jgi:hypothetical protein